ncbi:galaxin-like [Octopus sinensis]|uniref:Galaxin-like n=1 Tax=Octopus sinensis TaxID=2607531 RepID=A0A7E6F0J3_9MOLL|nr:galaxin-like [Octopus sinensis]
MLKSLIIFAFLLLVKELQAHHFGHPCAFINPLFQRCCGTYVASYPRICCGTTGANRFTQLCCNNVAVTKSATATTCCGDTAIDGNTQLCCNGDAVPKSATATTCCGNTAIDGNTQLCCNGVAIAKTGNQICCGGSVRDLWYGGCCGGRAIQYFGRLCCLWPNFWRCRV